MTAHVHSPLRVVAVSGGLSSRSKSALLAQHLLELLAAEIPAQTTLVELGSLAPDLAGAIRRDQLPAHLEDALETIEQADVLVVVSPVFRGAYTGLFKHLFDFIEQTALSDKPVLLAATGGSSRHALMIEHQLRPLFSFFQCRTCPLGVYATDQDFLGHQVHTPELRQRAHRAVQKALPLIQLNASTAPAAHGTAAAA